MSDSSEQDRRERATTILAFAVGALGVVAAIAVASSQSSPIDRPFELHWAFAAAAFLVAERFPVTIEVRNQGHSLVFAELPLTLGLIFLDPADLMIGRVLGATAALLFLRRMPLVKAVFNIGNFAAEAAIAVALFYTVLGSSSLVSPRSWIAALVAIWVSNLLSGILVLSIISVAGAPMSWRSELPVILVSLASGTAGCAVALAAAGTLWNDGRSWILLVIIGSALGFFFVQFMKIKERHRDLSSLHDFSAGLASEDRIERVAALAAQGISDLLKAVRVDLLLPLAGGNVMRIVVVEDEVRTVIERIDERTWATGLLDAGRVVGRHHRWVLAIDDRVGDSAICVNIPMPGEDGLIYVDGRRLATVRGFDDDDLTLLRTAVEHVSGVLHNSQLVARLRDEADFRSHQALHDRVTNLANRQWLVENVEAALSVHPHAAVVVRVTSVREVTETMGREMGDELLRQAATRIADAAGREQVAHVGVDEFAVIAPTTTSEALELAERITQLFQDPVVCDGVPLAITCAVGVSESPAHGVRIEELLRCASLAAGRSLLDNVAVSLWAPDRDPYDPRRLRIAADLRDAIAAGELDVHFQPQIDAACGEIVGVEALVRWHHPRFGELFPDQFIGAAEHTGAIGPLTLYVLEVATAEIHRLHEMGHDLELGVNVSARNLADPRFADDVAAIIDASEVPPSQITLELTESSVMTENEGSLRILEQLDRLGVTISVDDFGTGYSSLAHLRRLPVRELKIDKSFVMSMNRNKSDAVIVRSMIELGHNLGLRVVAEGVETPEHKAELEHFGCDRLQGYYFARAMSPNAFERWLVDREGIRHRAELLSPVLPIRRPRS